VSDEHIRVPQQYVTPPYYGQQTPPQPPQPPQPSRGWSGGAIVAAAVAGSIVGGILMAAAMLLVFGVQAPTAQQQQQSTAAPSVSVATTGSETLSGDQPIEAVAARVTPSVVNVAIEQSVKNPFSGTNSTQIVGNGSGVIIRSDGYILTNNHVVSGASKILVSIGLNNVPAKVIGADAASDIAVIKVDKTGLTAATLGDSEALKVGEEVVAIGSPFGLDKTVTSGIVSALHRTGSAQDTAQSQLTIYPNLIQTDAPINPGNSGGALCDLTGRVVGINTLIQTGGAQQSAGIGFSIPINLAKQVADQLIASGKATHTFLGVSAQDVTPQNAAQLGVKATSGALVQDVQAGSPAAKAGLKRGDVITKIGSSPIANSQDMVAAVRSHKPGDKVAIVVDRNGTTVTIDVTLGSSS
jgi:S1-C subfamily serine protease